MNRRTDRSTFFSKSELKEIFPFQKWKIKQQIISPIPRGRDTVARGENPITRGAFAPPDI